MLPPFSLVEVKLYRSTKDTRWFAFGPDFGWVTFPAEVAGWKKRQPTSVGDLNDMRQVPLFMGFNTGIPGAPKSARGSLALPLLEVRPIEPSRKKGKVTRLTPKITGCVGRRSIRTMESPPLAKSA